MKTWHKKYEWTSYAACSEDLRHTGEDLTPEDLAGAKAVCDKCVVRPECIQWALREKACSVVVAGVYLPDPMYKKELRSLYAFLDKSLTDEMKNRGEV